MKRLRVWGVAAALAAGPVAAADLPAPPEKMTLMKKLFGPSTPKPPGPTAKPAAAVAPSRPITVTAPLPPEVLADALRAEQDAYLRRVSVCTELRRVAVELGDDALARQADELERQAGALYNARVGALGVARTRSPRPDPTPANVVNLDGPTSPVTAASRLTAPAAPVPGNPTARLPAGDEVREVKP